MLNTVWKSSQYSTKTKIRLYQSCVLSTLMCGSECWRMTESDLNKPSSYHTKTIGRSCEYSGPRPSPAHIVSPTAIKTAWVPSLCEGDREGIRHVMRSEPGNISLTNLHWTPEGKQKRGHPKKTLHRTVERKIKTLHHTRGTVQKLAQNRQELGTFVAALHANQHNGHE